MRGLLVNDSLHHYSTCPSQKCFSVWNACLLRKSACILGKINCVCLPCCTLNFICVYMQSYVHIYVPILAEIVYVHTHFGFITIFLRMAVLFTMHISFGMLTHWWFNVTLVGTKRRSVLRISWCTIACGMVAPSVCSSFPLIHAICVHYSMLSCW